MEQMNNLENQNNQNEMNDADYELTHTDKIVGVFTEPGNTFEQMKKFGAKTTDWLLPLILVIIVAVLSNFLMMSNPQIKYEVVNQQMEKIQEQFDDAVAQGQISQEIADEQLNRIREQMENNSNIIVTSVSILIISFILFFIIAGVYHLFARFVLHGEGSFADSMSAYGLPHYIVVIQVILMVILAFAMDKMVRGTSVATFMDVDTSTFTGYLLTKADIFSIWFYSAVGIGFAKMFKSEKTILFVAMTVGLWLGFSILLFFLSEAVPFLKWFMI